MSLLFELNDARLSWHDASDVRTREPGAALIEDDDVTFGTVALARSRLHPRGFHNQHWQLLNSEALSATAPGLANNADLVYRHLISMYTQLSATPASGVSAAVPGLVSADQLGMLLGIMQEASIPLRSFVDSALLHSVGLPLPERSYCIDVHAKRGILTELVQDSAILRRGACNALPQMGLLPIVDAWLDLLVDQFVSRTRFDPLQVAATEQQVFDQVLDWLAVGGSLMVEVDHQGNQRAVDLSFEEMCARAQQRYVSIKKQVPSRATIVLTPSAAQLPGLEHYLGGHGYNVLCAPIDALWKNAEQFAYLFSASSEGVQHITALTALANPVAAPPQAETATHLLANHRALAMAKLGRGLVGLTGGWGSSQAAAPEVMVNDRPTVANEPLQLGDSVVIADICYQCIRLSDGPTPV
jgi:hypothetical protein